MPSRERQRQITSRLSSDSRRIVQFAEAILTHIPENATVLGIGAGQGILSTVLVKAGHRVTAID